MKTLLLKAPLFILTGFVGISCLFADIVDVRFFGLSMLLAGLCAIIPEME